MSAWTEAEDRAFRAAADGDPGDNGHRAQSDRQSTRLLTIADLAALPEPVWQIDQILAAAFGVLFGPSNVGKSFLALDWSLCIAAGIPWYGQRTKPGSVVYVAGEGVAGLYRRIQAWRQARDQAAPERIRFVANAVNLLDQAEVDRVKTAIATLEEPPALLVIDTMARCMVGGDENSAKDVGRYIDAVDQLRRECEGASLTVHHTGKDGDDERGSSALRGASDTVVALKPVGAGLRLECVKQKDAAPFEPWRLHLEATLESCILRCGTNPEVLAPAERQILEEVSAAFGTRPTSRTSIRDAANVTKSTFYRSIKSLLDRGFLATDGLKQNAPLYLTLEGQEQLVPQSPDQSHETGPKSPTEPSPLRDGGTGPDSETAQRDIPGEVAKLQARAERQGSP